MNTCAYCERSANNLITVANKSLIKIWNEMICKNHPTELRFSFCEKCYDSIIRYKDIKSRIHFKNKFNYILSENQCGMCLTAGLTTGRLMQEFEIKFLRETFHLAVTTDNRLCIECQNMCMEIESRRWKDDDPSPPYTPPLESNPPTPRDISTQPSTTADSKYFKRKRTSLYIKSLLNRQKKKKN